MMTTDSVSIHKTLTASRISSASVVFRRRLANGSFESFKFVSDVRSVADIFVTSLITDTTCGYVQVTFLTSVMT